ncbi:MAG: nucleotidyltransferase family protein [Candidatus Eisenbacteria bacterium]|nr:nucleotidyltransferase family protein [Candidatus Eisenbacteria bacterium]
MPSRIPIDREAIAEICRRHHIVRLALFGSVLREDFRPESDVDVLVEFEPDHVPGFFGLHRIAEEISSLFDNRRVDLLTFRSLHPRLKDKILASAEIQYAA